MSAYQPTPEQEQAIREYLQEAVVPLIEQVLVKKLGQAMSFAAEQLVQPKREWQGLTDEERAEIKKQANYNWETTAGEYASKVQALTEAKLKEKNT